jgi:hypothetical protein
MMHRSDNQKGWKKASDVITALSPANMDFLV